MMPGAYGRVDKAGKEKEKADKKNHTDHAII